MARSIAAWDMPSNAVSIVPASASKAHSSGGTASISRGISRAAAVWRGRWWTSTVILVITPNAPQPPTNSWRSAIAALSLRRPCDSVSTVPAASGSTTSRPSTWRRMSP